MPDGWIDLRSFSDCFCRRPDLPAFLSFFGGSLRRRTTEAQAIIRAVMRLLWDHPYIWLTVWIIFLVALAIVVDIFRFLEEHARQESESNPKRWKTLR